MLTPQHRQELLSRAYVAAIGGTHFLAVASLLSCSAQTVPIADESKLLLWRLCEWAGLRLRIPSPATLDKLHELALTDNPQSPDMLLEWLWKHSAAESDDHRTQEAESSSSNDAET